MLRQLLTGRFRLRAILLNERVRGTQMRKVICILLILVFIIQPGWYPAFAQDYETQYQLGIEMLYDIENLSNLQKAEKLFESLGSYALTMYYKLYIQALIELQSPNGDLEAAQIGLKYDT